MSTPTRVYRLTVKWPTPDGKPFKDQPWSVWDQALTYAAGGNPDGEWPAWLPEPVDILSHTPDDEGGCERAGCASVWPDAPMWELGGARAVWVPALRKRFYFNRPAAAKVASLLTEWGCTVTVDESAPIVWPELPE